MQKTTMRGLSTLIALAAMTGTGLNYPESEMKKERKRKAHYTPDSPEVKRMSKRK